MPAHDKALPIQSRPIMFRSNIMSRSLLAQSFAKNSVASTSIIVGRVFEKDIPISRRVSLYERKNGQLVKQVWSSDNGDYEFNNLPNDGRYYYIVTTDGSGSNTYYNAVTQDLIQAV